MRILLTIHHDLDPDSGAPGTTLRLAEEYERAGHDVDVLGFGEVLPARLPEQAKMVAFPWAVAARLVRAGREPAFDVIDASTGDAWLVGAIRRAFPRAVREALVVTRSHGLEHTMAERRREEAASGGEPLSWRYPLYHGGWRLREVARSLRSADLALFLNRHDLELAVGRLGVAAERAAVVRNGISDRLLGLPLPGPSPEHGGRIALIGSYIARKGVAHAAAALNAWLPGHPGWEVTFLGTGVGRDTVLADYEAAVHQRITVVPRYVNDDLPQLLAGHQIHLFPTLSEGGPLAPVEAMACGLVPLASAIPALEDLLHDRQDAVLVRPADPDAITEALDGLTSDHRLLDRLRRNAHRKAQDYGWQQVASEQLALYEQRQQHLQTEGQLR